MLAARQRVRIPWLTMAVVAAAGLYSLLLFTAMNHISFDYYDALIVGPVLLALSAPPIAAIARRSRDAWLPRLLWTALVLKLAASLGQLLMALVLYHGRVDARRYDTVGKALASGFRNGDFQAPPAGVTGTGFLMLLTGVVYLLVGSSLSGGFLFFSWLGFWGLYFLYAAFRAAVPEGEHKRYAQLLFFLPSMIFWPSAIGKEAWMLLCIGLAALGAAKLFTRLRFGYLVLTLGLAGAAAVRPHVALMLFAGVFAGYLFRSNRGQSILAPVGKVVGVALLVGTGLLLVNQATTFLGVEGGLNEQAINQQLDRANERTNQGGSSFQADPITSPSRLPDGAVRVLFRPFLWEAGNPLALLTAAESTVLIGLLVLSARRLRQIPSFVLRRPYVTMCVPYILLFVIGFASFGNFGILARQRVQVYPFLFVLMCLPTRPASRAGSLPPARQRSLGRASGVPEASVR